MIDRLHEVHCTTLQVFKCISAELKGNECKKYLSWNANTERFYRIKGRRIVEDESNVIDLIEQITQKNYPL